MKLEVYKLTNKQNGKIYIGITNQGVATRWCKHCSDARSNSPFPLHNAIRKYGKENFQIEIIEVIKNKDYDYLKERECFWIKEFDSYNRKLGYNLTLGGDGTFGRFHSEKTKEKIREKAKGRKLSEITKQLLSNIHKNRVYSKKELQIRSQNGINTRKKVLQYTLNNIFIKEYKSISEAALKIGINRRNISSCLSNNKPNHKTSGGFIWKYKI